MVTESGASPWESSQKKKKKALFGYLLSYESNDCVQL